MDLTAGTRHASGLILHVKSKRSPGRSGQAETSGASGEGDLRELCGARKKTSAHGHEAGDALFRGRVRGKERRYAAARERIDNEHVRGGRGGLLHGYPARGHLQFLQGSGQSAGLAADGRPGLVGQKFSRAGHGHLHYHGSDGRDDGQGQAAQNAAAAFFVAAAHAEDGSPLQHVSQHGNGSGNGGRHRRDEGVPVADVGQFMGHDSFQFVPGQNAHDTLGGRHAKWAMGSI